MDVTGSMDSSLQTAKRECGTLIDKCKSTIPDKIIFKLAFVTYADYDQNPVTRAVDFTTDRDAIKNQIINIKCGGGSDCA